MQDEITIRPLAVRPLVLALLGFAVVLAISVEVSTLGYSWSGWRPALCFPDRCFCEGIHPGTIAQPYNTWSGLFFVLLGFWVLAQGREDILQRSKSSLITSRFRYPALYGMALIILGLGTALYHASLTFWAGVLDSMGMYLVVTFATAYNISRAYGGAEKGFVYLYAATNAVLLLMETFAPLLSRYVFGLLVLLILTTEYLVRRKQVVRANSRLLTLATLLMAVGFSIWALDITKVVCSSYSWLQGHSVWHLLTAMSAGLLYLYYRSEVSRIRPVESTT